MNRPMLPLLVLALLGGATLLVPFASAGMTLPTVPGPVSVGQCTGAGATSVCESSGDLYPIEYDLQPVIDRIPVPVSEVGVGCFLLPNGCTTPDVGVPGTPQACIPPNSPRPVFCWSGTSPVTVVPGRDLCTTGALRTLCDGWVLLSLDSLPVETSGSVLRWMELPDTYTAAYVSSHYQSPQVYYKSYTGPGVGPASVCPNGCDVPMVFMGNVVWVQFWAEGMNEGVIFYV